MMDILWDDDVISFVVQTSLSNPFPYMHDECLCVVYRATKLEQQFRDLWTRISSGRPTTWDVLPWR